MICPVTAVSSLGRTRRHSFDWSVLLNRVVIFNMILVCLSVVGFAYYIAGVNAVASGEYNISIERTKIIKLTESQGLLTAKKSATEIRWRPWLLLKPNTWSKPRILFTCLKTAVSR